jgi:cobalt-zinc-cadmium efflux system outer membrane protein
MSPLYAQTRPLTLADAVSRAQQRAPALVAAEAALRAADANVDVAALPPNPTLSYQAENVLGTGRYADFGSSERTLSVSIPIELGGKREARRRVAEAERGAIKLGLSNSRADVTQRVTIAFIVVAAAEQRLSVTRSGHALAGQAARAVAISLAWCRKRRAPSTPKCSGRQVSG